MKRIKITALAALAVFAAFAALAGSASATTILKVTDPLGEVAPGTTITATSTNLVTTSTAGKLECENNVLPSTLSNNNSAKIKGLSSEEKSFGNFLGLEGACKTSLGIPAVIYTKQFPWTEEYKASGTKGSVTVKGTKKVAFLTEFLYPELGKENQCMLEASKIASTFTAGTAGHPAALVFTTTNQTFKLNKKATEYKVVNPETKKTEIEKRTAAICPETGSLSGEWTVNDANGAVSTE